MPKYGRDGSVEREPASRERFSETLDRLRVAAENSDHTLTFQEVVTKFGPKGHVLLILFLNLPFCQPVPIPGVSSALGICMMLVAYFMMRDQPPWLPSRLARVEIKKDFLISMVGRMEALMKRLEKVIRPRGRYIFSKRAVRISTAILLCFHAFLLSLPLPIPFSNFFPALALLLLCLGTLEEDVVVLGLGYAAVAACNIFFAALLIVPYLTVKSLT